jgi:hypothetical protein
MGFNTRMVPLKCWVHDNFPLSLTGHSTQLRKWTMWVACRDVHGGTSRQGWNAIILVAASDSIVFTLQIIIHNLGL